MVRVVKKAEERRKEILEAAREHFQKKGYESTTMQGLMQALNIAKGTIYHYFESKEEILEAVVEDLIDADLRKKEDLMKSPEFQGLNGLEKFRSLVTSGTMAEENKELLEELHRPGNTVVHARQLGRYLTRLAPLFADVIQEGCEQGHFQTEHPLEAAEFLLAGVQFLTDVGFYPWTGAQIARRMDALPSLVEAQLGASKGSFDFLHKEQHPKDPVDAAARNNDDQQL
jgi:AcrR family transcriptional regulator